jgi:hypothetical protein
MQTTIMKKVAGLMMAAMVLSTLGVIGADVVGEVYLIAPTTKPLMAADFVGLKGTIQLIDKEEGVIRKYPVEGNVVAIVDIEDEIYALTSRLDYRHPDDVRTTVYMYSERGQTRFRKRQCFENVAITKMKNSHGLKKAGIHMYSAGSFQRGKTGSVTKKGVMYYDGKQEKFQLALNHNTGMIKYLGDVCDLDPGYWFVSSDKSEYVLDTRRVRLMKVTRKYDTTIGMFVSCRTIENQTPVIITPAIGKDLRIADRYLEMTDKAYDLVDLVVEKGQIHLVGIHKDVLMPGLRHWIYTGLGKTGFYSQKNGRMLRAQKGANWIYVQEGVYLSTSPLTEDAPHGVLKSLHVFEHGSVSNYPFVDYTTDGEHKPFLVETAEVDGDHVVVTSPDGVVIKCGLENGRWDNEPRLHAKRPAYPAKLIAP